MTLLGWPSTGQVLRFDDDAYWGLGIGASIAARIPLVGSKLVHLMLGGPIIGGATLSRFFAVHVFIVPGSLVAFVGIHVLMVLKLGINEWPVPGRIVDRTTYEEEYHQLTKKDGIPFFPDAFREGPDLQRPDYPISRGVRGDIWAHRTQRFTRSDFGARRATTGLFLSLVVRRPCLCFQRTHGNAALDSRTCAGNRLPHRLATYASGTE